MAGIVPVALVGAKVSPGGGGEEAREGILDWLRGRPGLIASRGRRRLTAYDEKQIFPSVAGRGIILIPIW